MPLDFDWPFPPANKVSRLWTLGQRATIFCVGSISKIWAEWMNTTKCYNREILVNAIENREPGQPLITVSNHQSCLDDPMLWGVLDWRYCLNPHLMRWTPAAHDICFTQPLHRKFFAIGKTIPVVRGDGVYQKGMDYCIEKLNDGDWVHVFPEGGVNMTKELMRLKWGVGRLIAESKKVPIVVPMYHLGMDEVLQNYPPYYPRIGKKVTLLIGEPIEFKETLEKLRQDKKTPMEIRKCLTDRIQEEFKAMKDVAERLHNFALNN